MKIKTRRYYLYYIAAIFGFFIAVLPIKLGLYLAERAGRIGFALLKKERKRTLDNLTRSFPDKPEAEIEAIAQKVFSNLCKNIVELLNWYKITDKNVDTWIRPEGIEKMDRALSRGKGMILLCSHFGNWEFIHTYVGHKGYAATIIARRVYFDKYDQFIHKIRTSTGMNVVYRDESPKKILRALKRNEIVGLLADQDVDSVDGVFVDFFGRPAYTPKGPVAIALASGAPVLPCFMIRERDHHRFVFEDPVEMIEKSDREETITFNTQRWSRVVESYIRKYPEQWVWMHRRWKTKPARKSEPVTMKTTSG